MRLPLAQQRLRHRPAALLAAADSVQSQDLETRGAQVAVRLRAAHRSAGDTKADAGGAESPCPCRQEFS